jgi:DNA-binding CsgD family transcriptional regulator
MNGDKQANFQELSEGMSFKEESSGCNAVALSIKLKKEVYTLPQEHYCSFLGNSFIYAKPIKINSDTLAYLAIYTKDIPIGRELLAISELLNHCIKNRFALEREQPEKSIDSNCRSLTDRQREALLMFASGMTDKAAALEMKVCFDTIKYYKKNIFKKLNVNCTVQAVSKAIKLNIISADQIKF